MTLSKADIVEAVHAKAGDLSLRAAAEAVETTFEILKAALAAGDNILITGFGRFTVRDKAALTGRNPQTGAAITIDARRVVTFRCSRTLRDQVSAGR